MKSFTSLKARQFGESVIRGMTRICTEEGGVNLSQGFPDFPAPTAIKEAAKRAIDADINQYAVTWGSPSFRQAIAAHQQRFYDWRVDPDKHLTVACGATEAMIATLMATVNPGDEVIVFAPFYENYGPDAVLSGAVPRYVTLHTPEWHIDADELAAAFSEKTRAIIVNTPHNPTGKVFNRAELELIADLCRRHDVLAITDEIYEHIVYDDAVHIPLATLPDMAARTVTISGSSKTFSVTGWRLGYCIASEEITGAIRKVHDFLTVGAPAPLQEGAAVMLGCNGSYYKALAQDYRERRDFLLDVLTRRGFACVKPAGAYYIMADFSTLSNTDDVTFATELVRSGGVATVPGSSFFADPAAGRNIVRFCFCKKWETLEEAVRRLEQRSFH
ncbi:MAG: aminotransferase class I/II-fold pyridoxal phosphate-dependent enzyme [Deltaproteobacteria bacterium]|nr:aminotransferase class I/II-fold pyridoxal phosphate-dependent enzyme [Candidatus Anaeroferrophillacea bacterium]